MGLHELGYHGLLEVHNFNFLSRRNQVLLLFKDLLGGRGPKKSHSWRAHRADFIVTGDQSRLRKTEPLLFNVCCRLCQFAAELRFLVFDRLHPDTVSLEGAMLVVLSIARLNRV